MKQTDFIYSCGACGKIFRTITGMEKHGFKLSHRVYPAMMKRVVDRLRETLEKKPK